jgi:quercetin dioxygenase-like cupin family protein
METKEARVVEKINGCTVVDSSEIDGSFNLTGEDTGGAFSALIGAIPAGTPAPALHEHPTTDEAFYCAAGKASFKLGDEELSVAAGSLVFVPRGTVHTAWNAGSEDVRGIIFITPGDVEHEFVEV